MSSVNSVNDQLDCFHTERTPSQGPTLTEAPKRLAHISFRKQVYTLDTFRSATQINEAHYTSFLKQ